MFKQTLTALAILSLVACASSKPATQDDSAPNAEAEMEKAPEAESHEGEAEHAKASAEVEAAPNPDGVYGAAIGEGDVIMIANIMADPSAYADQDVIIEGQIRQVCQKMGCWFEMAESSEHSDAIRVKSAEHNIFIPKDSGGKTAIAQGKLMVREVSEEEAEHYRSEGATAEAGKELSLALTGVKIK